VEWLRKATIRDCWWYIEQACATWKVARAISLHRKQLRVTDRFLISFSNYFANVMRNIMPLWQYVFRVLVGSGQFEDILKWLSEKNGACFYSHSWCTVSRVR
jgi:aromatic ring-cleaving dioxygenase